ncbi:MAG: hypothetical protein ACK49R_05380 [Planctomycetota bacterium]|jgi:hypothetical protein
MSRILSGDAHGRQPVREKLGKDEENQRETAADYGDWVVPRGLETQSRARGVTA